MTVGLNYSAQLNNLWLIVLSTSPISWFCVASFILVNIYCTHHFFVSGKYNGMKSVSLFFLGIFATCAYNLLSPQGLFYFMALSMTISSAVSLAELLIYLTDLKTGYAYLQSGASLLILIFAGLSNFNFFGLWPGGFNYATVYANEICIATSLIYLGLFYIFYNKKVEPTIM